MPKKSAASKKNRAKKGKRQATLLGDSQSMKQDDLLLMAELAQAEAPGTAEENLEPEENMGTEAAAELIPEPSAELTEEPRPLDSSCSNYDDCETEDYGLNLEEGRGVNILKVVGQDSSGQQFALDSEALAGVLARPGVADLPVVVLGVAGAFRGGKSFLLDYLLRYLYSGCEHRCEEDWLGDARAPLAGFSWRGGCARDTSGLVLWSQPAPVALPSGARALVLLMDTQGAFDEHSSLRDSSLVFALSTLLASVQVYNVSRRIDESALQHLQLFTEYAALGGAGLAALTLLVRDWNAPYEYPYGAEGGARYLQDKLRVTEQQPEELRAVRRRLAASFESVECFLLPHPGRAADTDPAFRGEHGPCTRAHDERGLHDLRQELEAQAARHTEANERRLELALSRAADAFSQAVRSLDTPELCVAPRALPAALARARALAADSLERAVDCAADLPERATLLQELEERSSTLLRRLDPVNRANNAAAVSAAAGAAGAALRRGLPPQPCAHAADLAAAHGAARAAALDAFHSARGGPVTPDEEDEYVEKLERKIADCLRNHESLNERNNKAAVDAALQFYDRSLNLNRGCWHPDQLSNEHVQYQRLAIEYFCERRQGPNARESDVFLKEIEAKLSQRYNDLCEGNEQLNRAAIDAAFAVFSKTMDNSCQGLKVSDEDLIQKLRDAAHKAEMVFLGKRAEPFTGEDPYSERLGERICEKIDHYCKKNGSKLSAGELAGALATVGLVGGGLLAGGTFLALAAGRAGTAAAVTALATLLSALKK